VGFFQECFKLVKRLKQIPDLCLPASLRLPGAQRAEWGSRAFSFTEDQGLSHQGLSWPEAGGCKPETASLQSPTKQTRPPQAMLFSTLKVTEEYQTLIVFSWYLDFHIRQLLDNTMKVKACKNNFNN